MACLLLFIVCLTTAAILRLRTWRSALRTASEALPIGQFVTVEGCCLHYVRQGNGEPVVLLHGSDGFLQDFERLWREESTADIEFIAFDRPGHGWSDAPARNGSTLPVQARLLHDALQQLGVEKPLLVGHSWSGALCLYYALEYPDDVTGLVLASPWAYATSDPPSRLLYAAHLLGPTLTYALLHFTRGKQLLLRHVLRTAFAPDPVPADYARRACELWLRSPRHVHWFVQENLDTWRRLPELSSRYGEITAPTILLTGDRDTIVHAAHQANQLQRDLPRAELILVPDTGHELPQLRPHVMQQAVRRGLALAAGTEQIAAAASQNAPTIAAPLPANVHNDLPPARALVQRFGWNATAYQILAPGIRRWFSPDGEAVVGYVRRFRTRVAAGAPICAEEQLAEVATQFEQDAANAGERVCWFAATTRLQSALANREPYAALLIGAQPVWNPAQWSDIPAKNSSLRAQLNRARNKGVNVTEWPVERAANHPDLQACLDDWLGHHVFPTLHFLTEPVTLDRLADRRLFVAEANGAAVGFLILTPIPSRNGWLAEQIARVPNAPNGAAELLVDAAMRALAADGFTYVTLGLAPLSQHGDALTPAPRPAIALILKWAKLHGRRFYNFEGLDTFKSKFKPETWEPLFALSNEERLSLRTLLAIAAAFSNGPLVWILARAVVAAARQEIVWLRQKFHAKVRAANASAGRNAP